MTNEMEPPMFDDLNDPNPPVGDSGQFADVAERAARMRRGRLRVVVVLGAVALIGAGAIVMATSQGGSEQLSSGPALSAPATLTESTDGASSEPQATIESLPSSTVETNSSTTTEPTTTESAVTLTPSTTEETAAAEPATTDVAPMSPLQRPLVAVNADGDAVVFRTDTAAAELLYDGPDIDDASPIGDGPNAIDRISVAPDLSVAYVGLCCSPIVGTLLTTRPPEVAETESPPTYGSAPVFNPSGSATAVAQLNGISITDLTTDSTATYEKVGDDTWDTAHDLMWLDDTTLALLGNRGSWWSLTIATFDGRSIEIGPTRPFAPFREFEYLQFAGAASENELAMHDVNTDLVLSGAIDDYGNLHGEGGGSSLHIIRLPEPALSAWYTHPDQLIWVDMDRTLRVGDQVIPGEYTWARR